MEDDLNDAAAGNLHNNIVGISSNVRPTGPVTYVPAHSVVHSPQTIINRVQPGNIPCSVVRLPAAAGARVRPIGVNTPGVKRIIVRAVVPQQAGSGRINIGGQMVNITGSTAGGVQCLPGNIRVIRIPMSAASKMVTLPASAKSGGKIIVPAGSISRQQIVGTPKIVTFGSPSSNNAAVNRVVPVRFSNSVVPSGQGDRTQVLLPQGHVAATSQDVTMATRQPVTVVTQGANMSGVVHLVSGSATGASLSGTDLTPKTVTIAKSAVIRAPVPKVIQRVVQVPSTPQDQLAVRTTEQCSESTAPSTGVDGNTTMANIATPVATTTTNAVEVAAGSTSAEFGRSATASDSLKTNHVTACSTATTVSNVACPGVASADVNPASTDVAPDVVTSNDSVVNSESVATTTTTSEAGNVNVEKPVEVCRHLHHVICIKIKIGSKSFETS